MFRQAAATFGAALAQRQIELVWGGGHVGLMGVVADAALAAGGKAYGVIPAFMAERELAHPGATDMVVVDSMHTRKAAMAERAEAFVALPGGLGTMDELFEILTWSQLHIHHKPVGLLNVNGFFEPFLAMVQHMVRTGFVQQIHLDRIHVASEAGALLESMGRHRQLEGDWLEKVRPACA